MRKEFTSQLGNWSIHVRQALRLEKFNAVLAVPRVSQAGHEGGLALHLSPFMLSQLHFWENDMVRYNTKP